VSRFAEALGRVLADCLEYLEPRRAVGARLLPEQIVLEQCLELVEACVADGLGRLEAATAREDGVPGEQPSLILAQKAVAPVDRVPERLLAARSVPRSARQQGETLSQAVEQCLWREQPHTGRCELDCERQPVEPGADLRDGRRVARVDREVGTYRLGALDEQGHRVVLREGRQV